jgi:hypothetical protein
VTILDGIAVIEADVLKQFDEIGVFLQDCVDIFLIFEHILVKDLKIFNTEKVLN